MRVHTTFLLILCAIVSLYSTVLAQDKACLSSDAGSKIEKKVPVKTINLLNSKYAQLVPVLELKVGQSEVQTKNSRVRDLRNVSLSQTYAQRNPVAMNSRLVTQNSPISNKNKLHMKEKKIELPILKPSLNSNVFGNTSQIRLKYQQQPKERQ